MILLPGVMLRDFDEFYAKKASELVRDVISIPDKILSPIPHLFINKETWPSVANNVSCAHCDAAIVGKPLFIPMNIESDRIYCRGTFCDFPCLVAYVINDRHLGENYLHNIYYLFNIWHGFWPKYIPPAPDRLLLSRYGGNLTPSEFKRGARAPLNPPGKEGLRPSA